jgi:hypothetical protein
LSKGWLRFGIWFRNILIKINLQDLLKQNGEWLNMMLNSLGNMEQWKHFVIKDFSWWCFTKNIWVIQIKTPQKCEFCLHTLSTNFEKCSSMSKI